MPTTFFLRWIAANCFCLLLAACGGGGSGGGDAGNSSSTTSTSSGSTTPGSTTLNATAKATRNATAIWTAPTTRADGSVLYPSDIASYRVYYYREGAPTSEDTVVAVDGGSTSLNLPLTVVGTYVFAVTAIDTLGIESGLSAPVSVPVD